MSKRLVVLAGPDEGRGFTVGGEPLLLGRSRATETQLIDPHVARVHCQIHTEGDRCVLSDFDSEAGTFVNGVRISEHTLHPGDIIRIGNTRLQFLDDQKAAPARAADTGIRRPADTLTAPMAKPAVSWAAQLAGLKFGQFKIGPMFGKGKVGYVFHARHIRQNIDVALKVLDPSLGNNEKVVQRFIEAMKLVLPLKHPNLVHVHSAGKTGANCWVAMEYVRGESLAAVIGRIGSVGAVNWKNVVRIMVQLTRALVYAHGKNLIHQYITPHNVLVGKDLARTKLTDLMLDRAIERDPTNAVGASDEPSDDLPYMSPERTDGPGKTLDARTDIYSLGAVAYALLTGQPPLQAGSVQELVAKIRLQSPPSLKLLHFGMPDALELITLKMLAKRPEDRQQSAQELLDELERFAESQGLVF